MIKGIHAAPDVKGRSFDLGIVPVGYETRATYALEKVRDVQKLICPEFKERQSFAYEKNKVNAINKGGKLIPYSRQKYVNDLTSEISIAQKDIKIESVFVDVSSMSRPMMAQTCLVLLNSSLSGAQITFCYTVAKYTEPNQFDLPVTVSEPIIPELAGWALHPEWPPVAVVGLGYEADHAYGALEYLEPASAWLYFPVSPDTRYEEGVVKANDRLLSVVPKENIYKYRVEEPLPTFSALSDLVHGLKQSARPVIIPFGPKVFCLLSLLVALRHGPEVAVWRVSGEQEAEAVDRLPTDNIVQFQISL